MDTSSMSGAGSEGPSQEQQPPHGEQDDGHSGEGVASVLAHLKSQARQHRQPAAEADDAAGSGGHGQ